MSEFRTDLGLEGYINAYETNNALLPSIDKSITFKHNKLSKMVESLCVICDRYSSYDLLMEKRCIYNKEKKRSLQICNDIELFKEIVISPDKMNAFSWYDNWVRLWTVVIALSFCKSLDFLSFNLSKFQSYEVYKKIEKTVKDDSPISILNTIMGLSYDDFSLLLCDAVRYRCVLSYINREVSIYVNDIHVLLNNNMGVIKEMAELAFMEAVFNINNLNSRVKVFYSLPIEVLSYSFTNDSLEAAKEDAYKII